MEVIWTCPIISRTPSDPIFPQSALLNTYAIMVLCWGRCSFLSLGWVLLSSKEMPLTCSASCSRQSVGCGWVHDPQGFPLSGD